MQIVRFPPDASEIYKIHSNLPPQRPVASNNDSTFITLNNSNICLLAFTTSSLQPRVRAETCSVTTAPSPELSIIGTSFKSSTIRPFLSHASRIASFSSGTFSLLSRPKHSTTVQSSDSLRCTRNPLAELAASFPAILPRFCVSLDTLRHALPCAQRVVPHFRTFSQSLPAILIPRCTRASSPAQQIRNTIVCADSDKISG